MPLDIFLWGYLKNKVYRTDLKTLEDLKCKIIITYQQIIILQNITDYIDYIDTRNLSKTILNIIDHKL
jgi:hypothetical protein